MQRGKLAHYAPYLAKRSQKPTPVVPWRTFLPFLPHPEKTAPPQPPRPKLKPLPEGWERSFHAAPAAYPREIREGHGDLSRSSHPYRRSPVPAKESKEEKSRRQAEELNYSIDQEYAAHRWDLSEARAAAPKGLWSSVERWRRTQPRGGYTLVVTHANGLLKEQWHPALLELLARDPSAPGATFGTNQPLKHQKPVEIDEVWLMDNTNQAGSMDLNAGAIGPAQIWDDCGRDVLYFVKHVLPALRKEEDAGWHLKYTEQAPSRKVIGVGHSIGGNAIVQAAHAAPELFEAVFLVDPMCPPHPVTPEEWRRDGVKHFKLSAGALKRRDVWPSLTEARRLMADNPFYKAWDPAVFELWLSHGLVPVDYANPSGPVTLATPSWSESICFTEPAGEARGWDKLPYLPMPVGFVMAGTNFTTYGPELTQEMVWRPQRPRNERVMDAGHLITQEKPHKVADALWRFLTTYAAGEWGLKQEIQDAYAAQSKL